MSPRSSASAKGNWKLHQRRKEETIELAKKLRAEGLEDCKKETPFFKSLNIGAAHPTGYMSGGKSSSKVQDQWWAPAELVQLNVIMRTHNVSSKIRARNIRGRVEGKELSATAQLAVAIYTERILSQ